MNRARIAVVIVVVLLVIAGAAGFSHYTQEAAEAKERCRQDREDLIKMELVYRKYGPTGQFTTDLHELTDPPTHLWRVRVSWPYLDNYTAEINKFSDVVIIRCSVPGHDDPYAVSSRSGEQPDGTEHNGGLSSPWYIDR